jgi:hypothetical protein
VFPEELALKYGYRADQKVVNIITFKRFSSRIGQLSYALPTDGGRDTDILYRLMPSRNFRQASAADSAQSLQKRHKQLEKYRVSGKCRGLCGPCPFVKNPTPNYIHYGL